MRILWIINPIAGGGKTAERVISTIHEKFRKTGIKYDIVTTQKKGDGTLREVLLSLYSLRIVRGFLFPSLGK